MVVEFVRPERVVLLPATFETPGGGLELDGKFPADFRWRMRSFSLKIWALLNALFEFKPPPVAEPFFPFSFPNLGFAVLVPANELPTSEL